LNNSLFKRAVLLFAVTAASFLAFGLQKALGEEGGSGHYFPGSMASFIDGVSRTPAFLFRYDQIYYSGSVRRPLAGLPCH